MEKVKVGERYNPHKLFTGIFIPEAIVKIPVKKLSFGAKICFGRLCRYAGKNGVAFPKRETLAREIGSSERAVDRFISELKEFGLLDVERKGLHKSNRYHFIWHPVFCEEDESGSNPESSKVASMDSQDSAGLILRESEARESEENSKYHCNASVAKDNISFSEVEKTGKDPMGSEINAVIALFKDKRLFRQKTQREAAERLLQRLGMKDIKARIKFVKACCKIRDGGSNIDSFGFLPDISTPYKMECSLEKLSNLLHQLRLKLQKKHGFNKDVDTRTLLNEELAYPERELVMGEIQKEIVKMERERRNCLDN